MKTLTWAKLTAICMSVMWGVLALNFFYMAYNIPGGNTSVGIEFLQDVKVVLSLIGLIFLLFILKEVIYYWDIKIRLTDKKEVE